MFGPLLARGTHIYPRAQRSFAGNMMLFSSAPEAATRFLNFVNASPTPFHAVENAAKRLEGVGFQKVRPRRLHSPVFDNL